MAKVNYTIKKLATDVLSKAEHPLTSEEIWIAAEELKLTEKLRSVGKTPAATIYSDLHRATQPDSTSDFMRVGSQPRRHWLKSRGEPPRIDETAKPTETEPAKTRAAKITERDTHPLLAWFADNRMGGALVKTIKHERSKKKRFGEWVHPDLIGVLFPRRALSNERSLKLSNALNESLCKLYSFEMKLKVDFSNLRESFFQAVSNSTWANEGYLVATEFDDGPEFNEEIERLSQAFGIGTIHIPIDDPMSSEIKIPAKHKPQIDWSTLDKLADMNADVSEFLKNVSDDIKTDIHENEYDPVVEDPAKYLEDLLAKKAKSK